MQVESMPFLDRTYDEAKGLLLEARDYMQSFAPADRALMTPLESLRSISEGLRMTTRLTEVMAWSLTQRAVQCGEMTREEAATPQRRLGGQEICLGECDAPEATLPPRLAGLLRRSLSLYRRTQRLDRLVAGEEMQFGSFHICLAANGDYPAEERPGMSHMLLA